MFSKPRNRLATFLQQEDGPTAVEYAVMLALVIIICLGALLLLGQGSSELFQTVGQSVETAAPAE